MSNGKWGAIFQNSQLRTGVCSKESAEEIVRYVNGTGSRRSRHRLARFVVTTPLPYRIDFDCDGDAYLVKPDGSIMMTDRKLRLAKLLFGVLSRSGVNAYLLGFYGKTNSMGQSGVALYIDDSGHVSKSVRFSHLSGTIEL